MDPTIVVAPPALAGFVQATAAVVQPAAPPELPVFQVVNPLVEAVALNAPVPGKPRAEIISNFVFDLQTQELFFEIMDVNTLQVFFKVPEAAAHRVAAFNATLAANAGVVQHQIGTA